MNVMKKLGGKLPADTVVYCAGKNQPRRIVIGDSVSIAIPYLEFIYDDSDCLWATRWSRECWNEYPCLRPNAMLFDILLKNLHI